MLLGIHILGAWFLIFQGSYLGSGVKIGKDWKFILYSLLPLFTWMISGYGGSIFALLFVSLFLIFAYVGWERAAGGGPLTR